MSDTPKRKSGLGSQAFFKDTPPPRRDVAPVPSPVEQATPEPQPTSEPEQLQVTNKTIPTTIKLYPETVELLDRLKSQARREKRRSEATYGAILEEAIRDLAQKRGVSD